MRRIIALSILAAMPLAALDRPRLTLLLADREPLARALTIHPDRGWWPDYPRFLQAVRDHTRRGDSIAIVVPPNRWDAGYSYAYYRASWFLTGREVLPVIWRDDRFLAENLTKATHIAIWRREVRSDRPPIMQQHGGILLRQR